MASEYRTVLQKQAQGGFSESPEQQVGNSGSPLLDSNLTAKSAIVVGAITVQAKKVIGTAYQAVAGQLGGARLEEQMNAVGTISMFAGLAYVSSGFTLPAIYGVGEVLSFGINNLVEEHARNLENARLRATRGVRVSYNAGGYYG